MSEEPIGNRYLDALRAFQMARWQADMERLRSFFSRQSTDLLPFEEVRSRIKITNPRRGSSPQEIPLDAIVGSVGRYQDFTRSFLPRNPAIKARWAQVRMAASGLIGLPPIEVYRIGGVYFVLDGNHRVSVARQVGATSIEAYVSEIQTKAPLTPDDDLDDLIIKAEYAQFLNQTKLDDLRPDHNLTVTAPGQYERLLGNIDMHHYFLSRESAQKMPYAEAVAHWYDTFYLPAVAIIRERGMLRDFPNRTETDLYAWIAHHRTEISENLGWIVDVETAALDLTKTQSPLPQKRAARAGNWLMETLLPEPLEPGPPVGEWRREWLAATSRTRLFRDIVLAVTGQEVGWRAVRQAALIAQREEGQIHGLHLIEQEEDRRTPFVRQLREIFQAKLAAAQVTGSMRVEMKPEGNAPIAQAIADRARWADLVVIHMAHPPVNTLQGRMASGISYLMRRCPRPVLAVPGEPSPLRHGLLAYDGSNKAQEALFIAVYMAARWQIDLTIVGVVQGRKLDDDALGLAYDYAEKRGVTPTFLRREGEPATEILRAGAEVGCDFFLMGGYGANPLMGVITGSATEEVLRNSQRPVLICR